MLNAVKISLSIALVTLVCGANKPAAALPIHPILLSQSDWQLRESENGQFTVQMPGQPETRSKTIPIVEEATNWTILRGGTSDSDFYAVAYTDLSAETIELGADLVIESLKETLVSEFNWSALNNQGRSIDVNGLPGRELIGTQNNQVSILRLVLSDRRLYALMSTSDNLGNIGRFFDSFAIEFWQPYVFEERGFKVSLPLSPSEETESTALGGKAYDWEIIEGRNFRSPDESYAVGYTDIPSEDLQDDPQAVIEQVAINLIERLPLRNVVERGRDISLNGTPGRAYVAITESEEVIAVHFYLVGQRLYGVSARSEEITNISRFLNSFEIL